MQIKTIAVLLAVISIAGCSNTTEIVRPQFIDTKNCTIKPKDSCGLVRVKSDCLSDLITSNNNIKLDAEDGILVKTNYITHDSCKPSPNDKCSISMLKGECLTDLINANNELLND